MNFEHGRSTTVKTDKGLVRGFKNDGTYCFFGLDYAYADRYEVPRECEPWEGVKEATCYDYIAPKQNYGYLGNHIKNPYRHWPMSDHCQNLNVWTKDLDPNAKKPVIFWMHGGGFSNGSSIEHQGYEGFNLAKNCDLCVVTVNHRLNVLGYLDLSSFGEKYARTGNLGQLDLVEALRWVKRNIANFGGDPNNVTIMGQSGGGGKVQTLMGMPAADGLYHKAIIMSGTTDPSMLDAGKLDETVRDTLVELGYGPDEIEKLETEPHERFMKAFDKAGKAHKASGMSLAPHRDADFPGDPMLVGFSEYAKTVPLIIGGTFSEFRYNFKVNYDREDLSDEEVMKRIEERYGADKAPRLVEIFRKVFPEKKLFDLLYYEPGVFRSGTKSLIKARLRDKCSAPTYNYMFAPTTGIDGGSMATHSYEIPFFLHNTCIIPSNSLEGDATERVEFQCSERVANFARYGSPQIPGEVEWPACTEDCTPTLIIDDKTRVECNYDDEFAELVKDSLRPMPF
ncbi:MAG: carboxylesterase/lipase family protein [Erysipelotrichaceae bacterium]|nr:carboxylesterase/lipase family protein [Erysipelotrichaceae bacterium]